jgi:hypothetical protein
LVFITIHQNKLQVIDTSCSQIYALPDKYYVTGYVQCNCYDWCLCKSTEHTGKDTLQEYKNLRLLAKHFVPRLSGFCTFFYKLWSLFLGFEKCSTWSINLCNILVPNAGSLEIFKQK